jgi:hypothetical protein
MPAGSRTGKEGGLCLGKALLSVVEGIGTRSAAK